MDWRTHAAIALTLLPWASAFPGIRAGLEAYSPPHLTLLRFLVASLVLAAYALATRMPLPERRDWPGIAFISVLGITVYHTALNFGEVTVLSGPAALLIACGPVFTALLSRWILHERLSAWGWVGIAVAFGGVSLIALGKPGDMRLEPGALLILLAALATSIYFVLQKPYLQRYAPMHLTAWCVWVGTLPMLAYAGGFVDALHTAPAAATWTVVYLGVVPGALSYVAWTYALSKVPASRLTSWLYVNPVLATLMAYVWLREVPSTLSLIGGGIALVGVILVNTLGRARVEVPVIPE